MIYYISLVILISFSTGSFKAWSKDGYKPDLLSFKLCISFLNLFISNVNGAPLLFIYSSVRLERYLF